MGESSSVETAPHVAKYINWRASAVTPVLVFCGALLLTYGFLIFSFSLTIDEEFQLDISAHERATWAIREGRWAMAALAFLLPNAVAPVVSTGLGIVASGIGWWWLCRHSFSMPRWESAFAAGLAGTVPVLAFIFSFDTVAFAIGIGNLLLIGFMIGLESQRWSIRLLGVLAAAAAVGIYDTFILVIIALALAHVLTRPRLRVVVFALAASAGAFVAARLIGLVVAWCAGAAQSAYTSGYFDLAGLLAHPGVRLLKARTHLWETITLSDDLFGLSSPWLAITTCSLVLVAVLGVLLKPARKLDKAVRLAVLACLVLLPLGAELLAPSVPLRSMLYLPAIILVLCYVALLGLRAMPRRIASIGATVLAAMIILSVVGNASIQNRLFASAATSYTLDQALATQISMEKDRLLGDARLEVAAVVHGSYARSHGPLSTPRENLGRSFFAWDNYRSIQFLRSQGVTVYYASSQQTQDAKSTIRAMPIYPELGWMSVKDGVLLLNFSE